MHFPVAFQIFHQTLYLHAITEWLAFFVGYRYYKYLKKRQGDALTTEHRLVVFLGATLGALIGSRLLGALEQPTEWVHATNPFMHLYTNKTIVGGLLGGLWGVELAKKCVKETRSSGDLFTFPLILALIIGRIGCFTMGVYEETYGIETTLPWGMNLGDGLFRHPVALYEIIYLIFIWILLGRLNKKYDFQPGALFKIFLISYLLFRFFIEFIKPHFSALGGLSSIQIACLLGLLYYIRYIISPLKLIKSNAHSSVHLL